MAQQGQKIFGSNGGLKSLLRIHWIWISFIVMVQIFAVKSKSNVYHGLPCDGNEAGDFKMLNSSRVRNLISRGEINDLYARKWFMSSIHDPILFLAILVIVILFKSQSSHSIDFRKLGLLLWILCLVDGVGATKKEKVEPFFSVVSGGKFTTAGGITVNQVFRWDASGWYALGSGVSSTVYALAANGSDLYVGGYYTTAGGITVNHISRWDGFKWHALGPGVNSEVQDIAISGSDLYVGGFYTISRWDGSNWHSLGPVVFKYLYALALNGSDLYVGGEFTTAGVLPANNIARWDGSSWHALGSGVNGWVFAIALNGSELYAGGFLTTAGGISATKIARWNGSSWFAMGDGSSFTVHCLAIFGSDLYVGGPGKVTRWNGTAWHAFVSLNGYARTLNPIGSDLYVGGSFSTAGEISVSGIARWNGSNWNGLGTSLNGEVRALAFLQTCPLGSSSDSTACYKCPAGSFSNITGAHSCYPCPIGKWSHTGSSSCDISASHPYITVLTPPFGPILGNTKLVIQGHYFSQLDSGSISIKFSSTDSSYNITVNGTYHNDSWIECTTPSILASKVGEYMVDMKSQGLNWTYCCHTRMFLYYLDPIIASFSARGGPITGKTYITIFGQYLNSTSRGWCKFASSLVTATVNHDGSLKCLSPSTSSVGNVTLKITLNGQHYTPVGTYQYYNASLTSLLPKHGRITGTTSVTIQVTGFVVTGDSIKVKIQDKIVDGVLKDSTVMFVMPSFVGEKSTGQTAPVYLQLNGQQDSLPRFFTYYENITLAQSALSPSSGPFDGSTPITISGSNFYNTGEITVRLELGEVKVVAGSFSASHELTCTLPPMNSAGTAQVTVSLNGQQYSKESREFTYYKATGISPPDLGPTTGNTTVTISGTGFVASSQYRCKFGSTEVMGQLDGGNILCLSAPHTIGYVSVEISLGDQGFTSSKLVNFTYFEIPNITSITPSYSHISGGETITIKGGPFLSSTLTKIAFIGQNLNALGTSVQFISSSELRCETPAVSGIMFPALAIVRVQLNGEEKGQSPSDVQIKYYDPTTATLSSLSPKSGPYDSNTSLTLIGSGFDNYGIGSIHVQHDGVSSIGKYVSSTSITTTLPPSTSFTTIISLILEHTLISANQTFTYFYIDSADPDLSPMNTTRVITITGGGFLSTGTFQCKFGTLTPVSAIRTSSTHLTCECPISVTPSVVALEITGNGIKFTSSRKVAFTFFQIPTIISLNPIQGSTVGGFPVTITGGPFLSTSSLAVVMVDPSGGFQPLKTHNITFVSSNQLIVILPSLVHLNIIQDREMYVEVEIDGKSDGRSNSQVKFLCQPSQDPCDAGTYSVSGRVPCFSCPLGTFGAKKGMAACNQCPRNHYCDQTGLTGAETCPTNSVSDPASVSIVNCTCRADTYQENEERGKECKACSELGGGAVCPGGTERPYAAEGYWNSGESGDLRFYRCAAAELSCKGGPYPSQECQEGYDGRMCSVCSNKYYKLENLCLPCPPNPSWTIWVGAFVFLIILYLLKRFGVRGSGGSFGISMGYLQVTALFAEFRLGWPQQLLDLLSQLTAINLNMDVVSPECSFEGFGYSQKFAFTMALPWICLGILALVHGFTELMVWLEKKYTLPKWLKPSDPMESRRSLLNTWLMILSLLYIIVSSKTLEPFDCTQLASGKSSLDAFPDMECWIPGGPHEALIPWAVVFTLLYVVGIPLTYVVILYKYRSRVQNPDDTDFQQMTGILYMRFQTRWYWWEAVVMMRKLLLIIVTLNITNYPLIQGVFGQIVLLVSIILQFYAHPYARRSLNRLASGLLFCNFLILMSGLMFLSNQFETEEIKYAVRVMTVLVLSLSFAAVVVFFLMEVGLMLKSLKAKKRGENKWKNSPIWQYWKDRLSPEHLYSLQQWLEDAPKKDVKQIEGIIKKQVKNEMFVSAGKALFGENVKELLNVWSLLREETLRPLSVFFRTLVMNGQSKKSTRFFGGFRQLSFHDTENELELGTVKPATQERKVQKDARTQNTFGPSAISEKSIGVEMKEEKKSMSHSQRKKGTSSVSTKKARKNIKKKQGERDNTDKTSQTIRARGLTTFPNWSEITEDEVHKDTQKDSQTSI